MNSAEPLGTVLLEQRLDIGVKQLWLAAFCDSEFAREFQSQRGYQDLKRGHWHKAGSQQGTAALPTTLTAFALHYSNDKADFRLDRLTLFMLMLHADEDCQTLLQHLLDNAC